MTLSCITGMLGNEKLGLATGAEFLLARTEVATEPAREEVWWMQAMEWADKNGANIISSSLGYNEMRYNTKDMDGQTSLVARAANLAAAKGILVCNSMGNEGV
ncbi:MAG TPA: S8 family serine peptidase, partial [Bacteroidales bacterium]|nr:S8 family serine peptidase [Bacteroidales bacterium]